MDKLSGILGDGFVGDMVEKQIREKAADVAEEVINSVRGGGDKKEEEEQNSGLDVGNILQNVTGGNDDKGGVNVGNVLGGLFK